MVSTCMIGVDVGTTGVKAVVSDPHGELLGVAYREYTCSYPRPSWVEQDVDLLVTKSFEATAEAMRGAGTDPANVAAVSFSTQRCCTICVDAAGELVRPMISWQDNRTQTEVDWITSQLTPREFYEATNFPLGTTWMISKIRWLQTNEPDSWERTAKVVQLQDYMLNRWGVERFHVDIPDAVFYGLWDPVGNRWDDRLLSMLDLTPDRLPEPTAPGTVVGTVSADVAAATGLRAGTPLCVGAGDQNAAAIGAGVVSPGILSVSLGTAGLAAAYSDKPFRDPECKTMVTNHVIAGAWQVEGYQAGAAGVLRWFRDQICVIEHAYANRCDRNTYEIINDMVAKVPPGAHGLVMLPYFAGACSPRWNSAARGAVCGLTFAHDRNAITRAFMEGITLEVRDMITALVNAGVPIDSITVLGGPTRSEVWNQIQADMYGHPVQTLEHADAACTGAVMLAGVGAGVFASVPEACAQVVRVGRSYQPDAKAAATYDKLYEVYSRTVDAMTDSGVFEAIADLQDHLADAEEPK